VHGTVVIGVVKPALMKLAGSKETAVGSVVPFESLLQAATAMMSNDDKNQKQFFIYIKFS
jgi:hypothetical protein